MRQLLYLFLLPIALIACTRNVEDSPEANCDPGPVLHEINWLNGEGVQNFSVIIKPGDTVRWIWAEDDMPHDVSSVDASAPEGFGSEILTGIGNIYEFTFTEEVVFNYRCSVHPTTMFGTITVLECE